MAGKKKSARRRKARDPEYKALLARLARHFGGNERKAKRRGARLTTTTTASKVTQIRRMNPGKFKLFWHVRGRSWFTYDGENFSVDKNARTYATPNDAWQEGIRLRQKYPRQLGKAKFYVGEKCPTRT